jgi:tetratricopeptide (TPR) repeat protein
MVIGHERSYWRQLLSDEGMSDEMLPALEQAVALLTLCNGKLAAKDAKAVLARTPRLRELDPSVRIKLFDALRRLYPLEGGLAGLRPALLGETLIGEVLKTDDEVLDAAFGPDCSREDMRYALTVLTRLGHRVPEEQRWLRRALERNLTKISDAALDVGMETGSPMPEIFGQVIGAAASHERKQTVNALRAKIPKETLNLRRFKVAILRQSIEFLKNKAGTGAKRDIGLYEGFLALSFALKQSGLLAEAADAAVQAKQHAEFVFRSNKENDRSRLAAAFGNLAIHLSGVGRFDEALAAAEKAEEIWRGLAEKQPDAYTEDWANSLGNLANHLRDVGRFEEALAAAEKAETIWRGLAEKQPDAYTEDWAASLGNLGVTLRDVGRFEEALAAAEKTEAIRRGLAEKQPDAHTAGWANSLGILGSLLGDVGRFEDAIAATEKSEAIRRGLAEKQPDAYTADWAESLTNLADAQLSTGKFNVALDTAKEAVIQIRPFADRYPPVYKPWLGSAQRITADASFKMERLDQALADARRSVELWTEVAALLHHYVFVEAAKAFRTLMKCEIALGQNEAAIATLGRAFHLLVKPLNDKRLRPVMSELVDLALAMDGDAVARVVPGELLAIIRASS